MRRRRPGLLAIGIGCLVLPAAILLTPLRSIDWYQFKPTTFVLSDLQSNNTRLASIAWKEIDRRIKRNSLSDTQKASLISLCLKEQAAANQRPVTVDMLDHLGRAYLNQELTDQQQTQFLGQMLTCSVQTRPARHPRTRSPAS